MFTSWFTHVQQMSEMQRAWKEQLGQLERLSQLVGESHQASFERTAAAMDEAHQLSRSSLAYAQELGKHWRDAGLAAAKQAAAFFPGGA